MLTDLQCKAVTCPDDRKRIRVTDAGGLYLEATPASKRWYWKYSFAGKERRITFGAYPQVSIKEARLARDDARRILSRGDDPLQVRQDEKIAKRLRLGTTFEAVARKWHEHWGDTRTERHVRYVLTRLESDVFPEIGHRPVAEITAPHLIMMAKKIESRGAGFLARRMLQTCGQVFRFAIAHGQLERNPAADVKPSAIAGRHEEGC